MPRGVVCYSLPELTALFSNGRREVGDSSLRMIHEAKKQGDARVVDVVQTDRKEPIDDA